MIHAYRLNGRNIVLDAASGCVHVVDDAAYDAILLIDNGEREGMEKTLSAKYPDIPDSDIAGVIAEIDALVTAGKLFSRDAYAFADPQDGFRGSALKALCLNVSHLCNMKCAYCFAGKGMYSGEGELMSYDTGRRAIDFLIENSGGCGVLDIDFFGGEPLLNFEVVKGIVNYARSVERGSGKRFRFTFTTNGLLIDEDVIRFACNEMHSVVLSLDGRPEVNDHMRKLPCGGGSYNDVLPGISMMVRALESAGKGYYIRGTFTRENLDFTSDILHLANLGFTELSMEPAVSKPEEPFALTLEDLPKIFSQYEALASVMLARVRKGNGFSFYHYKLDLTGGPCIHKRVAGCGVGLAYMAVTPRGELYPCHQFIGDRGFSLGDIWGGVKNEGLRGGFGKHNIYTRDECKVCWARMYCSGGCAANAYHATGDIGGIYELGCAMFKKRIECAIMLAAAGTIEPATAEHTI